MDDSAILMAGEVAQRMLKRHGYWMALYHCTTLMIHCQKVKKGRHESTDWDFWQAVRKIIYNKERQ